ncbi:hypothetical protein [Microcoleus sp. FACHB-672]|uniref:hypothetical protein n=1 Tax=Microcoleus sp. FACHB-672 TaxID=2692825 RepID=UPI00168272F1|nr:hypothetical protein [Microcoleus sp. FACHB-672]MBD2039238.1 hypothetical protein [Microcoleus sp. FACHB-672]
MKKKISIIHSRVAELAKEVTKANLAECEYIKDEDSYVIRKQGELVERKVSTVAAGAIFLQLLGRV